MMTRTGIALVIALVLTACGSGSENYDGSGYISGDDDAALFTRGCQQYFRGSLSASKETFNTLIYRYPDSPLRSDAQMAARRIESELTGVVEEPVESDTGARTVFPSIAIVGTPSVYSTLSQLELLILDTGTPALKIEDPGAPDVTLVLYPDGFLQQANLVSDSLSGWLSSHSSVPVQPGGDIISSVAPSHSGVVVVVGTDAVVDQVILRSHSIEP